jgi:hypothetical protein
MFMMSARQFQPPPLVEPLPVPTGAPPPGDPDEDWLTAMRMVTPELDD